MTGLKCSLQYEEPRQCPTTPSMTGSEHAELPTNLQHEVYTCTLLRARCLLLSGGKSHQSAAKNMPRPELTDDSPTRVGEHTPRLTSLFSTPTHFFRSQKAPTNLSVNTTGYVRFRSSQLHARRSSHIIWFTERSNMAVLKSKGCSGV